RNREVAAVGNVNRTALCLARGGSRSKREGEGVRRHALSAHGLAVRGEISGRLALEDIEVTQRDVLERLDRDTEVLSENIRRRMREPFRHQESGELGGLAFVETDNKLAAVGAEALQRMRQTGREIPKVPFFHVGDVRSAHFVERR